MSNETKAGDVTAGRDFVGRDSHHDQSSRSQVVMAAGHEEWITAQIVTITNQLAQVNQRLGKLDQIDEALVGSRLHSTRGLVEDVRRLWAVVIGIVIFLALLGAIEVAQWMLLWRMLSNWPS